MNTQPNSLIQILLLRYRQFGGLKVVRHYAKMGVLWPMIKTIVSNPFSRKSYKDAYAVALLKLTPFLQDKYGPIMAKRKDFYSCQTLKQERNKIIWFCWLQGLDQAPTVVKVCYESLHKYLPDREIRVIDEHNYMDFVALPEYIVNKWEKRQIPPANFSDMLRLELLIMYGGTWIDSTVLCTGINDSMARQVKDFLDSDMFMFQYTQPGSDKWGGIGNWFISSCTNNKVLMVLRDMLFS